MIARAGLIFGCTEEPWATSSDRPRAHPPSSPRCGRTAPCPDRPRPRPCRTRVQAPSRRSQTPRSSTRVNGDCTAGQQMGNGRQRCWNSGRQRSCSSHDDLRPQRLGAPPPPTATDPPLLPPFRCTSSPPGQLVRRSGHWWWSSMTELGFVAEQRGPGTPHLVGCEPGAACMLGGEATSPSSRRRAPPADPARSARERSGAPSSSRPPPAGAAGAAGHRGPLDPGAALAARDNGENTLICPVIRGEGQHPFREGVAATSS